MKRYLVPIFLIVFCAISWFSTIKSYKTGSQEFGVLLSKATTAYEKKIYTDAEEYYKRALQKKPKDREALIGLAETYFHLEKYDDAEDTCEKILEDNPRDTEATVLEAKSLMCGGKYSKTVKILSSVEQTEEVKGMILEAKSKYTLKYFKVNFPKNIDVCAPPTLHLSVLEENENTVAYTSKGTRYVHGNLSCLGPVSEDGELFPAVEDNVWCYVDKDGKRKLVPDKEYEFLGPFSSGFAVAKRDGKFGYIDKDFNELAFGFENAYNFKDGYAVIKENGKIKIIDSEFSTVKETNYTGVLADEYGYTNHFGFSVFINDKAYFLSTSLGERISNYSADYIGLPSEEGAPIEYKQGDKYGFINSKTGKVLIEPTYDEAKSFSMGLAPIKAEGKWGFIDESGEEIVSPMFKFATTLSKDGSAWIKNEAGYALLTFKFLSE